MTDVRPELVATSADLLQVAESIADAWLACDATGAFLARNIETGEQFGFNTRVRYPIASVIKVPLALVALDAIANGRLDGSRSITIDPATHRTGPTGISTFQHPVTIAIDDLLALMLSVSDNVAADAVLELVGIDRVNADLERWGAGDIVMRHTLHRMFDCTVGVVGDDFGLAMELAVRDGAGTQHAIETLDADRANTATADSLVHLLQRVWCDDIATPPATERLRELMAKQVFTHRLSSDLRADTLRISAKTGSFLNLRHEIGVIETSLGQRVAVVALTRSSNPALVQQDTDLAIGAAARIALESLR